MNVVQRGSVAIRRVTHKTLPSVTFTTKTIRGTTFVPIIVFLRHSTKHFPTSLPPLGRRQIINDGNNRISFGVTYVCMYVCYECMYVRMYVIASMYVRMYVCYECMYVRMYVIVCMYVCMCVCYECMYVCVCVCMYVNECMYVCML